MTRIIENSALTGCVFSLCVCRTYDDDVPQVVQGCLHSVFQKVLCVFSLSNKHTECIPSSKNHLQGLFGICLVYIPFNYLAVFIYRAFCQCTSEFLVALI